MEDLNILDIAKNVIYAEQEGLRLTSESLDENFVNAIRIIAKTKGHVVLTGMGKPGHIARKVSATLASTGTKSFFLHPGEASHGDLGMLSTDDTLLVFSLSGNTLELFPLLEYAKRFGISIIGVTSNLSSTLAKAANVIILMPKISEATPNNLAPTTSSTIMLAIGDAVAVCLLRMKNFGKEEFRNLHPGGALGKRLLKVSDLMHNDVPLVFEDTLMKDAILEMTSKSFGCVGVQNKDCNLIGVITDGDLRRHISGDILNKNASDIMTRKPKVILKDMFAVEATKILNESKITSLFVVDGQNSNQKICGILHIHDCLRAGLC